MRYWFRPACQHWWFVLPIICQYHNELTPVRWYCPVQWLVGKALWQRMIFQNNQHYRLCHQIFSVVCASLWAAQCRVSYFCFNDGGGFIFNRKHFFVFGKKPSYITIVNTSGMGLFGCACKAVRNAKQKAAHGYR